ncbi:TIGR04255 family protein [Pseudomonas sp. W5-36]|uniref:TIGR04255 family protein n=1 Tax=Pseudomonas sp. W5-36 TaxID=3097455 RepID=UPI003978A82E
MSATWKADELIHTRSDNVNRFSRNFLKQAVCELRFPTLMELGEQRPPASFVKALRKDYPLLDMNNEFKLGIGSAHAGSSNIHILKSLKGNWSISLKESALTIETTNYTGFDNLRARILQAVEATKDFIDSAFFTRVGLRYINLLHSDHDDVTDWINPALIAPIASEKFTGINDFGGRFQLLAPDGGCLFQHGVQLNQVKPDDSPVVEYMIDIDTFRAAVPLSDTAAAIDIMHHQAFDLFDWAITERAREFLTSEVKHRKG